MEIIIWKDNEAVYTTDEVESGNSVISVPSDIIKPTDKLIDGLGNMLVIEQQSTDWVYVNIPGFVICPEYYDIRII